MLPSFKNNTLSANDFIKSISCDTTTIVVVLESSFNNEIKSLIVAGSRADVGSSSNITSGLVASVLAIATLCFSPPLNLEG